MHAEAVSGAPVRISVLLKSALGTFWNQIIRPVTEQTVNTRGHSEN